MPSRPLASAGLAAILAAAVVGAISAPAASGTEPAADREAEAQSGSELSNSADKANRAKPRTLELPAPGDARWRPVEFPSIERHTAYDVVDVAGLPAWRASGSCSASGRALSLEDVDLDATPILRWRWRVDTALPPLEERTKAGDDFAARLYVLFRFDPERANWRQRLLSRAARTFYDTDLPGGALNYVWSSSQARGAEWESVYQATSHMVALRSRADTGWHEERVDLAADRARFIPEVRTPVSGLAFMTDSDQSCADAVAWYASIRFEARERGAASP